MLDKTYDPSSVEQRQYQNWEKSGLHRAERKKSETPFTIMMPPPNVTGSLHMGHALNMTLQDILTRFNRMQGRDVLWLPGTDHAGIATQMVVERQLDAEGLDRRTLGREKFLERVWSWKEQSGGTITGQLRRIGALPDWSRERFTMDEGLSKAVNKAFTQLYKDGLIYRAKRLVNWDTKFQTAISDLEVLQKEIKGHLWHIRYPLADDETQSIVIATTRPETMFGDVAVAVHPDDERYQKLVGKKLKMPITGRLIPIVADDYVKSDFGTGALKITPAHDFNDFDLGKRHNLPQINIIDRMGHIVINESDDIPQEFAGLNRDQARARVLALLEESGALQETESYTHTVPHGDRSGVVIEPFLTDQWYVDAATMAKPALDAVRKGNTIFVPKNWENTYYQWLENIQPWCISRQLWWGHQIPAWFGPDEKIFVAETEADALAQAEKHYGAPTELRRDDDVLDTWFSSGLWPFSTLGWPDQTPDLKNYYPGSVLITGFDIIFFWVARMMMMGLHFMHDVPFRTIYIHALVRDQSGAKMSKSKGNVIDPLQLIDQYGADALRFTLTAMAGQGRDIKLSEQRVEGYRNFVTKIWNAARFCEMNECKLDKNFKTKDIQLPLNRWIVGKLKHAATNVTNSLHEMRFNDAANALYEFVWHDFCDWYVELAKPYLYADGQEKIEIQKVAAFILNEMLRLLHPVMPYVTEELNAQFAWQDKLVLQQSWPDFASYVFDEKATQDIDRLIALISSIRSTKSLLNVPPSLALPLQMVSPDQGTQEFVARHELALKRLARLTEIETVTAVPGQAAQLIAEGAIYSMPLAGIIDFAAEQQRLSKQMDKLQSDIGKISAKLDNAEFVKNAPEEIIEEQKENLARFQDNHAQIARALELLK